MLNSVLIKFGLDPAEYSIQPFGSGLINHTFKVTGKSEEFILQQINTAVFKVPGIIEKNITVLQEYLNKHYPDYSFIAPLPTIYGNFMIEHDACGLFRLFPFVKRSKTLDAVSSEKEAFEASKQFGRLTSLLKDFEVGKLEYTITDFHNLKLRFGQFKSATQSANKERLDEANGEIKEAYRFHYILQTYNQLIEGNKIPLRVIHHDTKISNILFDEEENGLCVIDLDTLMPGYYLSDVGDMMRSYLSPSTEEETDPSKIYIRKNIFNAICRGYLSAMGSVLTETELDSFIFSGEMIIYMQALRFLTDFLNQDVYYGAKYPGQNLVRSKNQFKLLNEYERSKDQLEQLIFMAKEELLNPDKYIPNGKHHLSNS